MNKLQPLSIKADGQDSDGNYCYRVTFDRNGAQVDHTFKMERTGSEIEVLTCDDEFSVEAMSDPAANLLLKAIASFHNAREFKYEE